MKKVSFSQFSLWNECQWKFKLQYIDGNYIFKPNIHLLFGSAIHRVLQKYLTESYNTTDKKANQININKLLNSEMVSEFNRYISEGYSDFVDKDSMVESFIDGVEILKFFKKNKSLYFPKRNFRLIGIEVPINYSIKDDLYFIGYIDVIIKDIKNNTIIIYDFKKSKNGWKKDKELKDEIKKSQLQLYKYFYSKQNNIPIDNIKIQFLILKQKVFENPMGYKVSRIQRVEPPSSGITLNKVINRFNNFIDTVFIEGEYNKDIKYNKNPSSNCKYCQFYDICDKNGENV